jgi:hypothetical protein
MNLRDADYNSIGVLTPFAVQFSTCRLQTCKTQHATTAGRASEARGGCTLRVRFAVGMAVMVAQVIQRAAVEHGQAGVQQVAAEGREVA